MLFAFLELTSLPNHLIVSLFFHQQIKSHFYRHWLYYFCVLVKETRPAVGPYELKMRSFKKKLCAFSIHRRQRLHDKQLNRYTGTTFNPPRVGPCSELITLVDEFKIHPRFAFRVGSNGFTPAISI